MTGQMSMLFLKDDNEDIEEIKEQAEILFEYAKQKRNWENAFQNWSDKAGQDGTSSQGICGYGSMCDWCEDNTYGRPCVRALNAMCRDKRLYPDYSKRDFESVWYNGVEANND